MMIEFTPKYAIDNGYNPKEVKFYLNDEQIDNRIITGAYVPDNPGDENQGWIDHVFYIPGNDYKPQFDDKGRALAVPKNIAEGTLNQLMIEGHGVADDRPYEPRIVRSMGKVSWRIEKGEI